MEVVVTEEKKKIFRARKTMKISDRQQLDTLHSTLLTADPGLSNPSPPPLVNGTHKEDGQKMGEKEQNTSDSNSPHAMSPVSPAPYLSLNLSPSPSSSQSPKAKDDTPTTPTSPFHSLNFELKKMNNREEEKSSSSSLLPSDSVTLAPMETKENKEKDTEKIPEEDKQEGKHTTTQDPAVDSTKDSLKGLLPRSPVPSPVPDCSKPMDTDSDATKAEDPEASAAKMRDDQPSSPKSVTSNCSPSCSSSSPPPASSSGADLKQTGEVKNEDIKEEEDIKDVKTGSVSEEKMDVETKEKKTIVGKTAKPPRPSSTPPSNTVQEEKSSTSGLKRTLSEGTDAPTVKREGKRPKMEHEELEAQLELKITAKAGSHHKLQKIVQQLVDERLKIMELTIFNKHYQELKDRVEKIDCVNKHQNAITTLQAKITRLSKKFGEANQASENKKKKEALAAAAAAASAAAAAAAAAASAASTSAPKPLTGSNTPQMQRPIRAAMEVKQITAVSSSSTAVNSVQSMLPVPVSASSVTSTSTAMVQQAPILQLLTSTANAGSTLATGITTQSSTGTLLLKTGPGNSMMATGQPLLILNGQSGTIVNFPVSSLSTANSLNKTKTSAPTTTTFILKPAPTTSTAAVSASTAATVSTLQNSTGQISLARVYQGGAGGITTPNAGVSVTTARTPAQPVSLAGALSSASSPATSGPAATGSTAPGPPQGISLTSKTDNQAAAPGKLSAIRPKASVIDLTEDDDDVQVTGVKSATVAVSSTPQRQVSVASSLNTSGARASPQSSPQVTVHHRPPLDSPLKSRTANTPTTTATTTQARVSVLPPLPAAPVAARLPAEAERTSPPQQPQLKLVPSLTGIVLSWCVAEADRTCATVDSYHLYAYHQDNASGNAAQQHWKKIGEVKALPLPMACTLTQFQSGSTYYFAVRAKDIYGRFGSFCEPQCTNVVSSASS